jgi:hypothetical protein
MMKAITCLYCGAEGVTGTHGLQESKSRNIFKHLGRNHVSGHLHFQCPACGIVLLVEPALIRTNEPIFAKDPIRYRKASAGSDHDFPGMNAGAALVMHS